MTRAQIIKEAIERLGYSAAMDWLAERHPELDGKSPFEMSGDDPGRVLALVRRLPDRSID